MQQDTLTHRPIQPITAKERPVQPAHKQQADSTHAGKKLQETNSTHHPTSPKNSEGVLNNKQAVSNVLQAVPETTSANPKSAQANYGIAQADSTLTPSDPKLIRPIPANEPLTCQPDWLTNNYWKNGLVQIEKLPFAQMLDSLAGIHTTKPLQPTGMAGDPIPYQFKNDNIVTIVLMASFFLVVWVISRSRHFLQNQLKEFFHPRKRENLFVEHAQNGFRGQVFLILQTCFLLGLLFFDLTQEKQVEVFNQVSPYRILGMSFGVCCSYYLTKSCLYACINNIFFERQQIEMWNKAYLLCVLGLGLALLPLTLLVIYFDLDFESLINLFLFILVVDKILLFYKCNHIFFNYRLGWVHLFLYFCTLEIAPLLILLRALIYANNFLLTIN